MGLKIAQKIGVIISSTRSPRAGPQIAHFVTQAIEDASQSSTTNNNGGSNNPTLHLIDLQQWNLPFFDEPAIPMFVTDASQYAHSHTRAWSAEVASHDAFIFVTPEYNGGYPASIKNAIDYLFFEWNGKPATVVSYGGHGGSRSSAQLRQVLQSVRMRVTERNVELTFPSKEHMLKAATGEALGLEGGSGDADGAGGVWVAEKGKIVEAYDELVQLLDTDVHV